MPRKILLIEDNPDHVLITKRFLEKADGDYQIYPIGQAREGLKKAIEENYDLILCDYRMPGLNALDILRELRSKGKDLPFIVVTASGSEKVAVDLMREGAYDYVVKDASYTDVLPVVIKKALERYNMKKAKEKAEEKLKDAYKQLKETQNQLVQASKMAAMGQLAAGISHELNQPLTGVKGFAQTALFDLDKDSPLRGDLDKIIEQANRMDKIIQNVRFFARKTDFKIESLDISKPIEDSLMLLGEQLKIHNIKIKKSLTKDLPRIRGNTNQLQQTFLNLITNAKDAIDSLKSTKGGEFFIKTSLTEDKKNIEVIFKDTGCGIPKEHLDNIFNPFFTTKSPDGGIGLGLSIVYRIIRNHRGHIEVESEEGKGTRFRIVLPVER